MSNVIKWALRVLAGLAAVVVLIVGVIGFSIPFAAMQTFDARVEAPREHRLVIEAVDILPMTGPAPDWRRETWVVIENGVIAELAAQNPAPVPGERRIDGRGMFLTPGLIDMHVHVFDRTDLLLHLAHGVTSVRNMMGLEGMHLEWRSELEAGRYPGPTLFTASPTLNQNDNAPFHRFVSSPEEARALVRQYAGEGYDFIKVYDGLERDVFEAVLDEAAALDIPVTGHLPRSMPLSEIIQTNIHSLEHVEEIYAYPLERMRGDHPPIADIAREISESDVYVTPTLKAFYNLSLAAEKKDVFVDTIPRDYINPVIAFFGDRMMADPLSREDPGSYVRAADNMGRITKALYDANAPLLLGSDTGPSLTISGAATHDEMARLAEFGLAPYDILYSGTARAAEALGQSGSLGVIAEGARADLLLVDADPLADLSALRAPALVIKDGLVYDATKIAQMKDRACDNMSVYETVGRLLWHEISK